MANREEYITASEARDLMGVSIGKMTQLLKSGEIPSTPSLRDKRVKLVKRGDVEDWIERAGPPIRRRDQEEREGDKMERPAAA